MRCRFNQSPRARTAPKTRPKVVSMMFHQLRRASSCSMNPPLNHSGCQAWKACSDCPPENPSPPPMTPQIPILKARASPENACVGPEPHQSKEQASPFLPSGLEFGIRFPLPVVRKIDFRKLSVLRSIGFIQQQDSQKNQENHADENQPQFSGTIAIAAQVHSYNNPGKSDPDASFDEESQQPPLQRVGVTD